MIRLRLELVPAGDIGRAQHLGQIDAWNTGEGTPERGHYAAQEFTADRTSRRASIGLLPGRATSAWMLAANALAALGYEPHDRSRAVRDAEIGRRLTELLGRELSWSDEEIERTVAHVIGGPSQ